MSREIRRENFSLGIFAALGASTQGKDVRIGSLQLIVHQDSAIRFQAGIERQLDIRPEAHRDHHKISPQYLAVCEAHGFDAAIAKHRLNFAPKSTSVRIDYSHVASAFTQPAPGFRRQPPADHYRARPFGGGIDNSPGVIERAEKEHAVFVQTVHGRNNGARSGCQNQFVVIRPIPVAATNRAAQSIDLLDANSQARPDPVLLIPLDVIQRDAVEIALAGEHTGQQRAVVVGVGFVAKNGDVENLPALEKLFHAGHAGHPVAHEDQTGCHSIRPFEGW
jgi:hypothetical protein